MTLCESIDTLAMAYLDDELAAEERHELEAHLTECGGCRAHVDAARADHALIRRALVAPPASELFRARLSRALDDIDVDTSRAQRRRWTRFVLPGSAMAAAAAALVVFLGVQTEKEPSQIAAADRIAGRLTYQATKHGSRSLPLEVQGASTGPWLRQHFASVEPPQFVEPGTKLLGARLLPGAINGYDAARLVYQIDRNGGPFELRVLVVRDIDAELLRHGTPMRVNDRTVYVTQTSDGQSVVSYVDRNRMGYLFMAPQISVNELVWLVSRTDLVGPQ